MRIASVWLMLKLSTYASSAISTALATSWLGFTSGSHLPADTAGTPPGTLPTVWMRADGGSAEPSSCAFHTSSVEAMTTVSGPMLLSRYSFFHRPPAAFMPTSSSSQHSPITVSRQCHSDAPWLRVNRRAHEPNTPGRLAPCPMS